MHGWFWKWYIYDECIVIKIM